MRSMVEGGPRRTGAKAPSIPGFAGGPPPVPGRIECSPVFT
ncbi:MAG: hypothetical protein QOG72_1701 [Sphingomonadales bacterium]|jgi:hypothetical protein|nr:hypothetical protein [Sphingomonadales bacterium]